MARMIAVAAAAALAILSLAAPANAQLTYISATGNDANNCFVQASPCKTLQRGINQTAAGGELRVLSQVISSGFINKSMTIDAEGHAIVGSFIVNGASATVAFRNIVLTGRGVYPTGFDLRNAAAVHIENCTAERFTGIGISIDGNAAEVSVFDSVSRDNGDAGLAAFGPTTVKLAIDNSLFENNTINGVFVGGGQASISNSVSSGNPAGFTLQSGTMTVTASTAAANTGNGFSVFGGTMALKFSTARGNSVNGLQVFSGATATISSSTFTNNATGVANDGTVFTLEDNTINGNTANVGGANALDTATVNYQ